MFAEELNGAVIDVSFISLTYILQPVSGILGDSAYVFALVKPQFECEGGKVGKRGVVRDAFVHKKVLKKIYDFAIECGLAPRALTNAPIKDGKNKEYVMLLVRNGAVTSFQELIKYVKL